MRIFTGKDYYDIGLSGGHDDSLIFQRREDWLLNHKESEAIGFPSLRSVTLPLRSKQEKFGITYTDKPFVMNGHAYHVYPVVVGFCGKLYHAYATMIDDDAPVVHWDETGFTHWLRDQGIEIVTGGWHHAMTIENYYRQAITPAIFSWMVSERIVTLSYIGAFPTNLWRINAPSLKEVQFAKVFDPYTAFQEITMWVGGILSGTENPIVQITDDIVKAEKHGFDKKLSFRKAKAVRK